MSTDDRTRQERVAEQTEIRHKLLENGYVPLANVDKRCMLKGWPTLDVDHDTIDDWADRRGLRGTGVRMEGDLVALDFDIDDDDMLDRIWDAVEKKDAALYKKLESLPLRAGKGAKVCLFGRLETGKIDKLWSKAFYRPDERATNGGLHRLEVFTGSGAGGARQVGVYGAHTVVDGEVAVAYRWAGSRGLLEVPLAELPSLLRKDVFALVDIVSKALFDAGWDYEVSAKHGKITEQRSYTLLPDMRFEVNTGETLHIEALESIAGGEGVRVSMSFVEAGAVNRSRGLVGLNPADDRVQIYDTATATLYRPADLDMAAKIGGIGAGLKRLGLKPGGDVGSARLGVRVGSRAEVAETGDGDEGDEGEGEGEEITVSAEGRCIVTVGEGDLTEATWLTARWLAGQDDLYRRGGCVTRVVGDRAMMMADARLSVEIGEKVMCAREEKAGGSVRLVEVDPPPALVRQVAAVVGEVSFRDLTGVVDVPVVRRDGSVVCADGWDRESGLLVQAGGVYEGVVDGAGEMTREEAMGCVDLLMHPFRGFPLSGPEARGALLAAVLTAVVRPALDTAPGFALDAPSPGSGKTLLGTCLRALAGGGPLNGPLPSRDEAEVAKVLLSVLVDKPRSVLFDNQVGMMDSAALAAVLTSRTYSGRILGSTRVVDLETNVLFLFSGNNIAMIGDMARRILTIRVDPNCDAPATRQFDFDALAEVRTNRQNMVVAALRLIQWAYAQPGRLTGRVGSFEMWDEVVGQTVALLGSDAYADPARLLQTNQEDDVRREEMTLLLSGLRKLFDGYWFRAADVVDAISTRATGHSVVVGVLEDALPKSVTARGVGMFLRFRRGVRVGDLRLTMRVARDKTIEFRVASDEDTGVVNLQTWREHRKEQKNG
jgi:hypothetical protein